MSRLLDRCGVVWRVLDRVSPWLAIAAVVVGYVIVHKQGHKISGVSGRNCTSITALAKIERRLVVAQAAQSKALIARGFTFGIPKGELPKLVAQGARTQATFLAELDELSRTNCRS